ncbi:MAG: hypothetical protein AAF569_09290 [Pseudomonadota bacterium]
MTDKILPDGPDEAVQKMIDLTQECLALAVSEDEKITRNDMVQFAVNDENKGRAFAMYEQAAGEFHERMDSLQGKVNPTLITELQRLQLQLREQAENNNMRLEQIEGLIQKDG